jgi:hypothetical protein
MNKDSEKEITKVKDLIEAASVERTPSLKIKSTYLISKFREQHKELERNFQQIETEHTKKSLQSIINNYNKIRDIILCNTDPLVTKEEMSKYNIKDDLDDLNDKPIKDFWFTSLKCAHYFEITQQDEKILNYLKDVEMYFVDETYPNFTVKFVFEENDYLESNVIEKTYVYEENNPEVVKEVIATELKFKDQKCDPRIKMSIKKKKQGKSIHHITYKKPVSSFFSLFESVQPKESDDKKNEDYPNKKSLTAEADFFKNDFFPNCLEYYLKIPEIGLENLNIKEGEEESDED